MEILLIGLLGTCAVYDLQSRTIPTVWVWGCVGLMLINRLRLLIGEECNIKEAFICILPGLLLLLFSYVSNQVGEGDGWLVIACGLCFSWENMIKGIFYAFLIAGIWGVAYLLVAHKSKNDKLPFVPSLFLGVTVVVIGGFV